MNSDLRNKGKEQLTLVSYLQSLCPMQEELIKEVIINIEEIQLKKGKTYRVRPLSPPFIFFVRSGMIRSFQTTEKEEITTAFFIEGECMLFLNNKEQLSAEEEVVIEIMSLSQLQKLFIKENAYLQILHHILEQSLKQKEELLSCLRLNSNRERYLFILEHQPYLIYRAMQKHLASYMGTTPENLSRIRKVI